MSTLWLHGTPRAFENQCLEILLIRNRKFVLLLVNSQITMYVANPLTMVKFQDEKLQGIHLVENWVSALVETLYFLSFGFSLSLI